MGFDVARVRGLYTSLGDGWTYLNSHQIPQVPERVASGVAAAFRTHAQISESTLQPIAVDQLEAAREAVAVMTGADPSCVVLGPTRQFLVHALARGLGGFVRRKAGVVLSRADGDWLTAPFLALDGSFRWAEPDLGTGVLPDWQYKELVDGSTRLVVLSAAHPLLGTVTPVGKIVDTVRERSRAWVLVDATSYVAYRSLNLDDWEADIVMLDLGEMGGPQISAMIFRDTSMFPRLDRSVPLELPASSLPHGLLGGVPNLVRHLKNLDEKASSVVEAMKSMAKFHKGLLEHLIESLEGLNAVHIVGISGDAAGQDAAFLDRVPRLTFTVEGVPAEMVYRRLVDNRLVTTVSPADPLLDAMGVAEAGGSITIGLSPFSTHYEIDQLTRVLASLA
ncbi:aminotransferase class V-fold PLP-dependent enzyme [Corynebacterium crudilactis]|uniref:Cysteine desulfurase n=1 Tax=Corynebacterium crudilactis TaxID=1652495 RepID=A0A172QQL2_9CORY|nr:aminotransferase class V-fold PLP-dependent enzyme [Corynebacterium crudilactis]ANE02950.1 cysteine desulfurase [Corynebacterium crudilactis]